MTFGGGHGFRSSLIKRNYLKMARIKYRSNGIQILVKSGLRRKPNSTKTTIPISDRQLNETALIAL